MFFFQNEIFVQNRLKITQKNGPEDGFYLILDHFRKTKIVIFLKYFFMLYAVLNLNNHLRWVNYVHTLFF